MVQDQADKAGRQLGATGETVRGNMKRIRDDVLRIPVTELSRRLEGLGRPIPPLGLRRIEDGTRRVDVDDLVSIAVALDVSPITLMTPNSDDRGERVSATAIQDCSAEDLWEWLRAERPLIKPVDGVSLINFVGLATPAWRGRQYSEGVLKLIELDRLQEDVAAGGDRADRARQKLDEMYREHGIGKYREHGLGDD